MKKLVCLVGLMVAAASANAAALQWDGTKWPNGSLAESYLVEGLGVDLAFTGATGALITNHAYAYNQALPTDNWNRNAWSPTAPDALWWGIQSVVQEANPLTLTITFDTPVTDLQFSLYDLDGQELVYLSGKLAGDGVNPSMVSPGLIAYTPATGRLYGNNINFDPGNVNNTATITFEDAVDTIVLAYSGPSGTGVMLGNLQFTVPEPATVGLLALGAVFLKRRKM